MGKSYLFTIIFLSSQCIVFAQDTLKTIDKIPKRTYVTRSIGYEEPPTIDGDLSDAVWNLVEWSGDFTENEPNNGATPSQQTKFRILYDDKFLYVGVRCFDSDSNNVERRLARRDKFAGDWIDVDIDSYGDKRTAFAFNMTAAGVKGDGFLAENGKNWDPSWNPVWFGDAKIDEEGWTAEMKIPFSQVKFGKAKEQIWGLQINRKIFAQDEQAVWQAMSQDAPGWVSEMGILRGLVDIQPQKQLEIQPFIVTQLDTYPKIEDNPFRDGSDLKFNGGLDAKIGITNDLTLDLTVNPDFGQVDADPGAIALDGFQIFFEERRPFFVENKNIFNYQLSDGNDNVFYSRRIGRSPHGTANISDLEFAESPINTTILGAAKFSGKTKKGWSIGLLESVTGKMFAEIDNNGDRRKEMVEPLTNYLVGRLQKDFNHRNSYFGGIFTATNRNLPDNLEFLHKSAYTGGIDFRHNWGNRNYYIEGNFVTSMVNGSKEAIAITQNSITHLFQRVDASHVAVETDRTSLTGTGGKLKVGKAGGGNWRYNGGFIWKSPELELNDVGFLRQADEIRQFAQIQHLFLRPNSFYRRAQIGIEQYTTYDYEGNYNRMLYELAGYINYKNNWSTEFLAAHKPRIFSNTALRGGPRWRWSDENFFSLQVGSDRRKKFNYTLGYVNSQSKQNNFSLVHYSIEFNYQPFDAFSFSTEIEYEENPNKTQYVTETSFEGAPRYIMAHIDNRTFSTSIRFNYSINPNLSIQYYGQPFIARGIYSDFNFVNNSIADDLDQRVTWYDSNQIARPLGAGNYLIDENLDGTTDYEISDPDFAFVQFRSNLVVRLEYVPGSEIFLVWSQGVTGNGDPIDSLGRNLDAQIFGNKKDNTFLIKATYRFF
ncbi:hydrolase [Arenibacter sp. N53]|uniref:DUF5916 domain-containing protein n=1 Tax=Arenibacter TaxID=178469 RepID=UPI000CD4734B|nr:MULTISPECIES: DUF5916 domain-containing protein [Arenibacter]MCM4150452.1 hydrolase [Arenibacter sp. N53]